MGLGDEIMATGLARGAAARGKRIAFGDGSKITWSKNTEAVFRNNPNIAHPGSERDADIEWNPFRAGFRTYHCKEGETPHRWVWNPDFRAPRGEIFLTLDEKLFGQQHGSGFVVVEPNVMVSKQFAHNKQWPVKRYDELALRLKRDGHRIVQFAYGAKHVIPRAHQIKTKTFRQALAVLQHAALFIGGDGGLQHGAAALNVPAVVIFGAFADPLVTGYPEHTNIAVGEPCGSKVLCAHCVAAMKSIPVDQVYTAAKTLLGRPRG